MSIYGSQTRKIADQTEPDAGLPLRTPGTAHILMVSDNDSDIKELKVVFQKAGLTSETARSITAGCESAISRRFQVIFSTPVMADGSWRRLVDIANHYGLSFEVILLARTFDFNQWAERRCRWEPLTSWTSCATCRKLPRRRDALWGRIT